MEVARINFSNARYDGTNDVQVEVSDRGELRSAVVATGKAVLFIEFGTGVNQPDGHPEQQYQRGTYGKGYGKFNAWGYYGEPGTNGIVKPVKKGSRQLVITRGNPSNMSMYDAKKHLEQNISEIVRRCFDV